MQAILHAMGAIFYVRMMSVTASLRCFQLTERMRAFDEGAVFLQKCPPPHTHTKAYQEPTGSILDCKKTSVYWKCQWWDQYKQQAETHSEHSHFS